ncbi:MAG: helix-turn-helix domain-containing protein [Saprospiraceae bacterium]
MTSGSKNSISAQFWRSPKQPALEFAKIEYEKFHFEPHFHDHYVIMLVEKGVNLGQRCREKYAASPGEMLLLQPGEMHTGSSFQNKTLQYLAFYPEPSLVAKCLEKLDLKTASIPDFKLKYQNPVLSARFRHLARAVSAGNFESLAQDIALLDFFEALSSSQSDRGGKLLNPACDSQKFKKARAYIQANFTESFSLNELADAVQTSPFHLIRLFRQHCGLTPFAFLRSFRVEQAKGLIRKNRSLTEVAYRTGFFDQSHFIHNFKRLTGLLPSEFQSQRKGSFKKT